ncbi:Hsp33 family molecular chaperone HslO [Sphingosinicella rhizophila]|uniref:Hsp33 family molecular chaperone HslO n=1 Tax=Sphingosinicella rhizophila TaxID=3050082 RepID=A0ABU3Q8W5_9SPHN|nr:Hsp33 family molecular chaperone HslO [Sphingosinicella sp. GR2756]MDT9599850.1 Hsp33 family molecular chaperone HslO [Sphingosinicella sp. GR2756]
MTSLDIRTAAKAANLDEALGFTISARNARGRLVRIGPTLDQILSAHDYPAPIARILSEALVLTGLFGAMLKDAGGQLTVQAQTESGVIDLLVCDYKAGELRGYVRFDRERLGAVPSHRDLFALFGKGYLAITFDQAVSGERYQGIVPLEGASLAEAAQNFFSQSEQIPSLVRLAVNDTGHVAGGILVQHLPEGEEGRERLHTRLDHPEWEHVRVLAETIKGNELVDQTLPLETLLWRLFHEEEEIRILAPISLAKGCRCNFEHIRSVISRFPAEDREQMVDQDGFISVDCEFCSRVFPISLSDFSDPDSAAG